MSTTEHRRRAVSFGFVGCGQAECQPALEHDLRDRERDRVGMRDPRTAARTGPSRQAIVHEHTKCGEQVVNVGEHEVSSVVDVAVAATPTFNDRFTSPRMPTTLVPDLESLM